MATVRCDSIVLSKFKLAPGAGFEPAANWLHLPHIFIQEWTISSSIMDAGRYLRDYCWAHSLVSEPSENLYPILGLAADYHILQLSLDVGFPQFTLFSLLNYLSRLPLTANCSTAELPRIIWYIFYLRKTDILYLSTDVASTSVTRQLNPGALCY